MDAGREMDALIHEKVMGWPKSPIFGVYEYPDGGYDFAPPYSTDIAAAWPVVEKLERDGFRWSVAVRNPHMSDTKILPYVSFWHYGKDEPGKLDTHVSAEDDTVPLAICRAALKAVWKGA